MNQMSFNNPANKLASDIVSNPEFQDEVRRNASDALTSRGVYVDPNVELQVHTNTDDLFYVVFPPDPNVALSDESLNAVAGGKSASSAACGGSASSVCTAPSCASSASSASTASTAASAS